MFCAGLCKKRPRKAQRRPAGSRQHHELVGKEVEIVGHKPARKRGLARSRRAGDQHGFVVPSNGRGVQGNGAVEIVDQRAHHVLKQYIGELGERKLAARRDIPYRRKL